MFNVLLSLLMLMKFATSVTAFFLFCFGTQSLHNGVYIRDLVKDEAQWLYLLKNKCRFLPAVTTNMVQEGAWVEFSALSGRGKYLGRSGCLQWINTWCKAHVADRSLAPTTHAIRRSKDFKAGERSIWQGVAKRVSLGGFKPNKDSLKLVNYCMMESKHTVFNLMVHHV